MNRATNAVRALTIDAEDTFTAPLLVNQGELVAISVAGTVDALVVLQRRFGADDDWRDVPSPDGTFGWSAPTEQTYQADAAGQLRIGVKEGDFGSGEVAVRLGKG
jgi:hypothetical protein